eukprot:Nitzschia sp. Nitz4//scaffold76_size158648//17386//19293//NITZ4_002530-RA/size158648-processed-gene-0.257-mRNA-1//-1//CDS//3329557797//7495//frame0
MSTEIANGVAATESVAVPLTEEAPVTVSGEETTESGDKAVSSECPEDEASAGVAESSKALKVLFLSSDTGGGHRASAQSLARQFELLFPGSTYDLLDLATEAYLPPYNSIVSYYKHLSANPSQWKLLYGVTNSRFMEKAVDTNIRVMNMVCEKGIRTRIKSYEPDVVVSVHPLQTSVPILSCAKISHETGMHLPMFTVVTDLGSAHSTWFANGVEKMFVGSTQIQELAKDRGQVPDDKLVLLGLPIRHDFAVEAEKLGERYSPEGLEYQKAVRAKLGLPAVDRKTLLVMGGGEGVGSLSNIVDALYAELTKQGIDAVICVVCGRNEALVESLKTRDWDQVLQNGTSRKLTQKKNRSLFPPIPAMFGDLAGCGDDALTPVGCIEAGGVTKSLRKILSSGTLLNSDSKNPVFIPSPTNAIEEEKKEDKILGSVSEDADEPRRQLQFKSASISNIVTHPDEVTATETQPSEEVLDDEVPANTSIVSEDTITQKLGNVDVVGLGFITNMAEYMVAADVLISKAGPGTISEAAALSLPVMLTSFLPGQEEGNVDYVVDGGFGTFCQDSDPVAVGEEVAQWLRDEERMKKMSDAAKAKGAPFAARDIVQMIGDSTLEWKKKNQEVAEKQKLAAEQEAEKSQ